MSVMITDSYVLPNPVGAGVAGYDVDHKIESSLPSLTDVGGWHDLTVLQQV